MNASTFLTNISTSLRSLEEQSKSLSIITDDNELKLEEIHKSITNLATLVQQQNNSVNQHIKTIEENIDELKSDILNKINEILSKVANQNGSLIKSRRQKKIQSVDDDSLESDENDKLNPYDLTPTLVALIRNKMKENEQNNEDSDTSSIENEFSFDYSKAFTHKNNRKVLKAYLLFYTKDYESRGDKLSNYIYIY